MHKFLSVLAVLPFLAGVASAAQPLDDRQMDTVVAGTVLTFINAEGEALPATTHPDEVAGITYVSAPSGSIMPVNIVPPFTFSFPSLLFP